MYLLLIFLPLLGSFSAGLFGRKLGPLGASYITVSCLLFTFFIALFIFYEVALLNCCVYIKFLPWINSEMLNVDWGFLFDSLTAIMCCVVTFVSSIVHIYSTEYMAYDPHLPRFMSYLSLFTFFMLILVTADNFVQMFVGWEGVGLCSYLLINFWFTRIQANKAAIKAMILNRIGDFGLVLGILIIFVEYKAADYATVFSITPIFTKKCFSFFSFDFSITNLVLVNFLVLFFFSFIIFLISSDINQFKKSSLYFIPSTWQVLFEMLYEVSFQLLFDNINKKGEKYFPFISVIFIFILLSNLIGLIPYSFTTTSHIIITFTLFFSIFLGINLICIQHHKFHMLSLFIFSNTSIGLALLLVPIEFISYIFRPIFFVIPKFVEIIKFQIQKLLKNTTSIKTMNLELINCVMFQDHLLTFDNLIMNAQVFGLLFTLFLFCSINQVIKFFKKKEIPLLAKTPEKDSSPSKGSKKRKEGEQEPGEPTSEGPRKKAKSKSPQAEQNAAPDPDVEEMRDRFDNVLKGNRK